MHIGSELIAEFHQVVFFFPLLLSSLPLLPPNPTPPLLCYHRLPPSLSLHPHALKNGITELGQLSARFLYIAGKGEKKERKRQKSSSPGRLLNRLNTPPFQFFSLSVFDKKKERKFKECFRLTILIADSSEKINSLMSRAVSLIKVLERHGVRH